MMNESLKIKLSQFMLAYQRQCAELQFQRQNIKQNVMLSIIENRNQKNNNINDNQLQKSLISSKLNQNLASSKQTKFSQQKYNQGNNLQEHFQRQNQDDQRENNNNLKNSTLLERSNISMKSNRSSNLKNNLINASNIKNEQVFLNEDRRDLEQNISSNFNKQKIRDLRIEDINQEEFNPSQVIQSSKSIRSGNKSEIQVNNNQSQLRQTKNQSRLRQNKQVQIESNLSQLNSINMEKSRLSAKNIQRKLQNSYSDKNSNIFNKSNRNASNGVFTNLQNDSIANPSLILNEQEEPEYPTFQKPSFQFISNMQDLRQSDPNYQQRNYDHQQHDQRQQQQHQQYSDDEGYKKQQIADLEENQSVMVTSEINLQNNSDLQQERRNYAFEINMDKSNIPSNESIQDLRKKKILELQRKRQQRMENNSRKKTNASEISKKQKGYSNVFVGSRINESNRKQNNDNRDSLNKSINDKRSKNIKTSQYCEQQGRDSAYHDNKTIISKYGQQSRLHNRSISPLNTVKTINTDKRPPLNRNRKEDNIFAPQSNTFQRQKSSHKLQQEPKIVPIDRKNSFQKKSNIKIMINAITYTCLPGELNRRERQKLIDVIEQYQNQYFLFLFKQYSRKVIKGIYTLEGNQQKMVKIYGDKAPTQIFPEQVHQFYRFDSGSRQFKKIDGCKCFSFSVHAIDLK